MSRPTFIWYELTTSDPDAAVAFYRSVVGWNAADAGQPGMRYTILSAGDRGMGGVAALSDAGEADPRPGWLGYVCVPDTDAAAKRIAGSGGAIHRPPDDIPGVGRFAVVADPGGAVFQLLTPHPREDAPAPSEPGTPGLVGWHELHAADGQEAAFRFYAEQYGWESLDLMEMGPMGRYRVFGIDGIALGGMLGPMPGSPISGWLFYVNVDGLDAAVGRIEAGGGKLLREPHEVPGGSWIVQATDPQGALFALVSARR